MCLPVSGCTADVADYDICNVTVAHEKKTQAVPAIFSITVRDRV
jgi:hypothetical protein